MSAVHATSRSLVALFAALALMLLLVLAAFSATRSEQAGSTWIKSRQQAGATWNGATWNGANRNGATWNGATWN